MTTVTTTTRTTTIDDGRQRRTKTDDDDNDGRQTIDNDDDEREGHQVMRITQFVNWARRAETVVITIYRFFILNTTTTFPDQSKRYEF